MGQPIRYHYHLMGIGGTGMSGLAELLHGLGHRVSGCDLDASGPAARHLRSLGVEVAWGHDPAHVEGADVLVVSSAIAPDHPEREAAVRLGVPVRHRAEVLAEALAGRRLVAVAGAHGKTTTTGLIAHMLTAAGLDPTVAVGYALPGLPTGARLGGGPWAVAEVDESDGSFLAFRPDVAVVTTIEPDHLENWGHAFERLVEGYARFLEQVRPDGVWVLGVDSPALRRLLEGEDGAPPRLAPGGRRVQRYGLVAGLELGAGPRWTATDVRVEARGSRWTALCEGRPVAQVRLAIPGRHNVANALAALAVAEALGLDLQEAARSLQGFQGARRRFEVLAEQGGVMVVDDYAHHPTEIAATIRAAREGFPDRRLVAVFQPHRYHRTAALLEELAGAFDEADAVVLTEVYGPPPERPIPGVDGQTLYRRLLARPAWQGRAERAWFCPTLEQVQARALAEARPGTLLLVMGAGSITRVAHALAERLRSSG
ncbi:MAG TPA: UDP-N-acetylmuramate--L-alanine ligase [Limnochordales bacterium]